jgi:hypothetical protein
VVVTAAHIPQLPDAGITSRMQIFIADEMVDNFESDLDCMDTGEVNCSPDSDFEHSGSS